MVLEWQTPQLAGRGAFNSFFYGVGTEDDRIQQEIQEGKENIAARTNYSKQMDIREDEEKVLHTIALDAYHRLTENSEQLSEARHKFWRENGYGRPDPPEIQAINQNFGKIIDETLAKLRQQLGEETFTKVDYGIFDLEGGAITAARDQNGNVIHDQEGRLIAVPGLSIPLVRASQRAILLQHKPRWRSHDQITFALLINAY